MTTDFMTRFQQAIDNRITFDTWLTFLPGSPLPAPVVDVRHDGVFVTVADLDDLAEWVHECGGPVHRSPEFEGLQVWTLYISTGPESRNLPVRVSAVGPVDADVMDHLLKAVA
jgi:hypothetical protein